MSITVTSVFNSTMIFEPFQSGFATYHSTETALLKVMNDLLLAVDSGENAVLILLDLSAAFDTVDHDILLSRLEHWVGIKDTALSWFKSYLKSRTLSVAIRPVFLILSFSPLWGTSRVHSGAPTF